MKRDASSDDTIIIFGLVAIVLIVAFVATYIIVGG